MGKPHVISLVLNAHLPFIRHIETPRSAGEHWFFESLSNTYLPLLEVLDRLDGDRIPFRLGIAFSPALCSMLQDEMLCQRYLDYTDRQIEFAAEEIERTAAAPEMQKLARFFYDRTVDKRILFTEKYEGNILSVFDLYQKKGRVEFLATAAGYAFLPLYTACPEAIQAQFEVGIASHRSLFGKQGLGFWLPELGWAPELDPWLRSYNFGYTIVDTHSLLLGKDAAARGSFYPVRTPAGVLVLARDHYAGMAIEDPKTGIPFDPAYRDCDGDLGYELPSCLLGSFQTSQGERLRTGFSYWTRSSQEPDRPLYDPALAAERARRHAAEFLDDRVERLTAASQYMEECAVSLCAYDADRFGRFWYEGPLFIEALFRQGAERTERDAIQFMTPSEYLFKQNGSFQIAMPGFSSWGRGGYGEMWLDSSNDWFYCHGLRSLERMIEMAERFPNDSGLKERALNQAAREILLVQAADWPKMLYKQEYSDYARSQIETILRNFITIYESLGSNYVSTEWLTSLEKQHPIFPSINYRVFRRKR